MMINCKGKTLDFSTPRVMGILNVSPDSFYDGGKYDSQEKIALHAEKMVVEGASIIDIGAVSTRPGAEKVSTDIELQKLIPAITAVRNYFPEIIISADTYNSKAVHKAIEAGADIINDVSGGTADEKMMDTVAKLNVPYIIMHIQGTPKEMQINPFYDNVVADVMSFFIQQTNLALSKGIKQIIIDPGFGFGKTVEHNYLLLSNLSKFQKFGFPILAGISRKSMINKVLGTKPENALNGTTVTNTIALMNGADILRVHDVKEAMEAIKIFTFVSNNK